VHGEEDEVKDKEEVEKNEDKAEEKDGKEVYVRGKRPINLTGKY
jgi:hypothetical protein